MSVTVYADTMDLPATWGVYCHTEGARIGAAPNYAGGKVVRAMHLLHCEECATWGCFTESVAIGHEGAPEVNLSNANAGRVLALLGYRTDSLCGSATAAEVLSRAEGYLTLVESPAIAWDGYAVDRVTKVAAIARYAAEHGLRVCWG